jgi:hypothetical protein
MTISPFFFLADVGQPLFGNQWLALIPILGSIAVFLFLVAALGRWLAATHPDAPPPVPVKAMELPEEPSPEVLAAIAAAVATTLGAAARVAGVRLATAPPDSSLGQWSLEGRREIYSSHRIR